MNKGKKTGASLAVQWLGLGASITGGMGLSSGQETKILQAIRVQKKIIIVVESRGFHLGAIPSPRGIYLETSGDVTSRGALGIEWVGARDQPRDPSAVPQGFLCSSWGS